MKLFVEPKLKVTRFEYENIMLDPNEGASIPEVDGGDDGDMEGMMSLWGE